MSRDVSDASVRNAHRNFGRSLPIPELIEIGAFGDGHWFAVSARAPGRTLNEVLDASSASVDAWIPRLLELLGRIHRTGTSAAT